MKCRSIGAFVKAYHNRLKASLPLEVRNISSFIALLLLRIVDFLDLNNFLFDPDASKSALPLTVRPLLFSLLTVICGLLIEIFNNEINSTAILLKP